MSRPYDVTIIGMGPAGLAAASRLGKSNRHFAILDAGRSVEERDRSSPDDITMGHGGAGLFSDGKFSFFPSASELWSLPNTESLEQAYDWTCSVLENAGLDTPPFPSNPNQYSHATPGVAEWMLKAYPCDYLSLEGRLQLVRNMVAGCNGDIFGQWQVEDMLYRKDVDNFRITIRHKTTSVVLALITKRVLVATGRLGPLQKPLQKLTSHHTFKRLEVGVRIQQTSSKAFFRHMKQLDPKLRIRDDNDRTEWRTFCVCREGETCFTQTGGYWTVSGHSDCPATGVSNCGFNTRVLDEDLAGEVKNTLLQRLSRREAHFKIPLHALLDSHPSAVKAVDRVYGRRLREKIIAGLDRVTTAFSDLQNDPDAQLIGPTLEGIGWYPDVDGDLRLLDAPAWVAGDACGLFRGIVASMISGHYAASAIVSDLTTQRYRSGGRTSLARNGRTALRC